MREYGYSIKGTADQLHAKGIIRLGVPAIIL